MPAWGFACRAARTKTAKHACESLIPPVVIQHPSLLWLHSLPFQPSQPAYSSLIFPWARERRTVYRMGILYRPFANEPPPSCWLFIYTIVDTCITHRSHPFPFILLFFLFFSPAVKCTRLFVFFFFFFFYLTYLLPFLFFLFSLFCIHFDFNDDVVLFRSTRFFFIYPPYFFPLLVIV